MFSTPYVFSPGTPAQSAQVNANFAAIKDELNAMGTLGLFGNSVIKTANLQDGCVTLDKINLSSGSTGLRIPEATATNHAVRKSYVSRFFPKIESSTFTGIQEIEGTADSVSDPWTESEVIGDEDTELEVTITPRFDNSKILLSFSVTGDMSSAFAFLFLCEEIDGEDALLSEAVGQASGNRTRVTAMVLDSSAAAGMANTSMSVLISTNGLTEPRKFKLKASVPISGAKFYVNHSGFDGNNTAAYARAISTLTAQEVIIDS